MTEEQRKERRERRKIIRLLSDAEDAITNYTDGRNDKIFDRLRATIESLEAAMRAERGK